VENWICRVRDQMNANDAAELKKQDFYDFISSSNRLDGHSQWQVGRITRKKKSSGCHTLEEEINQKIVG
jgi:hypothetical protein